MGNAATTKKGDSTESGEYLCGKYNFKSAGHRLKIYNIEHVRPLSDRPCLCFFEGGES